MTSDAAATISSPRVGALTRSGRGTTGAYGPGLGGEVEVVGLGPWVLVVVVVTGGAVVVVTGGGVEVEVEVGGSVVVVDDGAVVVVVEGVLVVVTASSPMPA